MIFLLCAAAWYVIGVYVAHYTCEDFLQKLAQKHGQPKLPLDSAAWLGIFTLWAIWWPLILIVHIRDEQ